MNATALILVDLQAAAFGAFGIPALHDPDHLLRNARTLLHSARASSVPVIPIQTVSLAYNFLGHRRFGAVEWRGPE